MRENRMAATADLRYWITPLLAAGRLGERSEDGYTGAFSTAAS